jgi:hypothetical protein
MVCDALALSALAADETAAYGRTIVHQIEQLQMSRPRCMVAALSGDRARIKQRIAMITQFRKETFRWSPLALVLIGVLACTGLTDGLPVRSVPVYGPAKDVPTTHQDKHANIIRIHICNRETGKYLVARGEKVTCDVNPPDDACLWEARFDEDLGGDGQRVFIYSVATRKYLAHDAEGNVAANASEPNDSACWGVLSCGDDCAWITVYQFADSYLRATGQGQVRVPPRKGEAPDVFWHIDQVWRVKISDDPKSNPEWRRRKVPGPDWGPPWSLFNGRK